MITNRPMNTKTKTGSMFLLAAILLVGTLSMTNIPKSFAEPGTNIQEIKCVNFNVNLNGVDVKKHAKGMGGDLETAEAFQGNGATGGNGLFGDGGINIDKNLVNICVNVNVNKQVENENGQTCKRCFTENLEKNDITELLTEISDILGTGTLSLEELCQVISDAAVIGDQQERQFVSNFLLTASQNIGLTEDQFFDILDCINDVFNDVFPEPNQ